MIAFDDERDGAPYPCWPRTLRRTSKARLFDRTVWLLVEHKVCGQCKRSKYMQILSKRTLLWDESKVVKSDYEHHGRRMVDSSPPDNGDCTRKPPVVSHR